MVPATFSLNKNLVEDLLRKQNTQKNMTKIWTGYILKAKFAKKL